MSDADNNVTNAFNQQKRKTVVLAASLAAFQLPGLLLTEHLHGSRYLPAFVIGWALLMALLLAYVVVQLSKLMKMKRSAR
jgi:hypothetical protein